MALTAVFTEMDGVEQAIREAFRTVPGYPRGAPGYLLENRGKMLRPRLLLTCFALAAGARKPRGTALFRAAAAVEMIHNASLAHDDILDEALQRRGRAALHLVWGLRPAVLAGDLLLARAFALLSGPGSGAGLLRLMARSVALLCRGELHQMSRRFCWELTENQYYRIIHCKTAQFIASCCEAGGRLAGASPGECRALRRYGLNLGQAFQLMDDWSDYADYPQRLGKPAGNDLKQGLVTLPLIRLFKVRRRYLQMAREAAPAPALTPELRERLGRAVRENGCLGYTHAAARQKQEEALQALQLFPEGPERQALAGMAAAVTGPAGGGPEGGTAPP